MRRSSAAAPTRAVASRSPRPFVASAPPPAAITFPALAVLLYGSRAPVRRS